MKKLHSPLLALRCSPPFSTAFNKASSARWTPPFTMLPSKASWTLNPGFFSKEAVASHREPLRHSRVVRSYWERSPDCHPTSKDVLASSSSAVLSGAERGRGTDELTDEPMCGSDSGALAPADSFMAWSSESFLAMRAT
eukprot:scaffold269_cov229-Pinguiococcus_pyrenoidosus.AAC.6